MKRIVKGFKLTNCGLPNRSMYVFDQEVKSLLTSNFQNFPRNFEPEARVFNNARNIFSKTRNFFSKTRKFSAVKNEPHIVEVDERVKNVRKSPAIEGFEPRPLLSKPLVLRITTTQKKSDGTLITEATNCLIDKGNTKKSNERRKK